MRNPNAPASGEVSAHSIQGGITIGGVITLTGLSRLMLLRACSGAAGTPGARLKLTARSARRSRFFAVRRAQPEHLHRSESGRGGRIMLALASNDIPG
jgi:hypothetical protein